MFTNLRDAVGTLERQSAATRSVLAAVPQSAYAWKPHARSRSAGELAWHVATGLHWFVADALKLPIPPKPAAPPASTADLLEAFDAMTRDSLSALKKKSDAWIRKRQDFFGTPTTIGGILGTHVIHEAHHRGQLTIHIRMTGGAVPAVCGPSADDPGTPPPPKKPTRARR